MKICSFLPSATEILYALGLEDDLVGVTYACDNPSEPPKPVVVRSRMPESSDSAEIDRYVREYLSRGESLYSVDDKLLEELAPDLIVTQDLCHVCAASPDDLPTALAHLPQEPKVLTLSPKTLQEVWVDILSVGEATRHLGPAADLVNDIRRRMQKVENTLQGTTERPRVLCLEWLSPPFVGGHWMPDMVALAGGEDVLGKSGHPSFTVTWDQVLESRPDVVVICPCGFGLEEAVEEFRALGPPEGWADLPAVQAGKVYAVDADHYFSRPSQGLAGGVELLAHLLHPGRFDQEPPAGVLVRLA
jgi:iron complex transport system substrate-binding protein